MSKFYRFANLVKKYSVPFQLQYEQSGFFNTDTGIWTAGEKVNEIRYGALVPYDSNKSYLGGGFTEEHEMRLFSLSSVPINAIVTYKGRSYKVEGETDYTEYADFYEYKLRWVKSFDTA